MYPTNSKINDRAIILKCMRDILKILKQKKLQFIFLSYILLLLPFLSPLAENITFWDKLAIFVVCGLLFTAILILSTFISSKTEKIIYAIILTVAIIPGAIFLSYLLFANVLLEQNSVTSLFETNQEESKEFVAHYLSIWIVVGTLIYTAIPIVMICMMKSFKPLKIKNHKKVFFVCIAIVIAITGVNRLSRSVYFINFYKTFINYKLRVSNEIKDIQYRQTRPFDVQNAYQDSIPQSIVLVIGESETRHHMSLYGYPRKTTPLLDSYPDSVLYAYNDVISPQVHTIPVMRSLLSMSELEHPEYFTEKPSMFELFNRAGYETYLLSNQEFSDKFNSSYDILLSLANNKYNLAPLKQHDDIVLGKFDKIINDKSHKKKLIIIHLIGNHMAYKFRYPKEYIVFNHNKDNMVADMPFGNEKSKTVIDQYDNSVLYNDFVVDSIIKILAKQEGEKSAMLYLSDHGEELYDYRDFAGHAYEKVSPPMCEIPFILWTSNRYRQSRRDLIIDEDRPYSSEDFIYSVSDIAGLKYDGYDDERSLFSSAFKPRIRYVGEKEYENIKKKYKE